MFCENCGTLNADDSVFCKNCGSRLNANINGNGSASMPTRQQKKPGLMWLLIALSVIVVLIIVFGISHSKKDPTSDVSDENESSVEEDSSDDESSSDEDSLPFGDISLIPEEIKDESSIKNEDIDLSAFDKGDINIYECADYDSCYGTIGKIEPLDDNTLLVTWTYLYWKAAPYRLHDYSLCYSHDEPDQLEYFLSLHEKSKKVAREHHGRVITDFEYVEDPEDEDGWMNKSCAEYEGYNVTSVILKDIPMYGVTVYYDYLDNDPYNDKHENEFEMTAEEYMNQGKFGDPRLFKLNLIDKRVFYHYGTHHESFEQNTWTEDDLREADYDIDNLLHNEKYGFIIMN